MPRFRRVAPATYAQHVLNRGNERAVIFHKPADYEAFLAILARGLERFSVGLIAFCLMPNHFHLVLIPADDLALSAYMRWTMNVHVRRYRRHHCSTGNGHIYQDRFKNFIIDKSDDVHLLTVIRYVEGNASRAGLAKRAEDWPWSSLSRHDAWDGRQLLRPWPIQRPDDWADIVNAPFSRESLERIRESAQGGVPFGADEWTKRTAKQYGLEYTLRPAGRPKRQTDPLPETMVTVPICRPLFE